MPPYPHMINPYEQTIQRLQDELSKARRTIIEVMPEEVQNILTSYYSCTSREDGYRWEGETADSLVALAQPMTPESPFLSSPRAYCPLCGRGAQPFPMHQGLRFLRGFVGTYSGGAAPCGSAT
jgi:hypothetical protein